MKLEKDKNRNVVSIMLWFIDYLKNVDKVELYESFRKNHSYLIKKYWNILKNRETI